MKDDDDLDRVITPLMAAKILGVSQSTFNQIRQDEDFPDRVQLTERRYGWLYSELMDFLRQRKVKGVILD